jgi:hypothetical protein
MSHDADNPIIIRPGAGALVPGMNMVHKVDAGRLEGGLLIMEGEIAAGRLIRRILIAGKMNAPTSWPGK